MSTIFLRGGKFLSAQYKWEAIPHLFPEWQAPDVIKLMAGWKDAADGMAVVDGSAVIDLDALEVMQIEG